MSIESTAAPAWFDHWYAAYLTVEREALGRLFGRSTGQQAATLEGEELDKLCERAYALAVEAGLYASRDEAEASLAAVEEAFGKDVPYHEAFYEAFPATIVACGLPFIESQLDNQCRSWEQTYPFFSRAQGGYQYLQDLLVEARYRQQVEDAPSAGRAIDWLQRQIQLTQPPAPGPPPGGVPAPAGQRRRPEPAQLHHVSTQQLATVLAECGVSPTSRAGKWAAVVSALRRLDLLTGSHVAVQKWLTAEFGAPSTIRRTLSDKAEHNTVFSDREEKRILDKVQELLKQYCMRAAH